MRGTFKQSIAFFIGFNFENYQVCVGCGLAPAMALAVQKALGKADKLTTRYDF